MDLYPGCVRVCIDSLDQKGLIDRTRVGITGWSRSGMYASYTLTHSNYPFAAAAFTSTGGFGYWDYLGRSKERQLGMDRNYGGESPLGKGLASWLEMSPGFNFERVRTPTFMWEEITPWPLWDWYSAMRRLGVPVEYWYLPAGAHQLSDVDQRLTTVQLIVDWFRFWLKDERDPDPAKSEQYARWEAMRKEFANVNKEPRPPLLHWTAAPTTDTVPRH